MSSFQVFYFHNNGKPGPKHVAAYALIVKSQKTLLNQVQPSPKTIRLDQERLPSLGSFDLCRWRAQLMTCFRVALSSEDELRRYLAGANIGRWNGGSKQLHEAFESRHAPASSTPASASAAAIGTCLLQLSASALPRPVGLFHPSIGTQED